MPSRYRSDQSEDRDGYQEECNSGSTSRGKLFEEDLAVEKIEQKFALTVRQFRFLKQGFNLTTPHMIENRTVVEQCSAHSRIMRIEKRKDRNVEADLVGIIEHEIGNDSPHGVAQNSFSTLRMHQMLGWDGIAALKQRTVQ